METDLVKRATQLDWELARRRAELARIEREFEEREHSLATLKAEIALFQVRYFQALARPHAELDALEARIAEKMAQLHPEDATRRRKAERARAQADESAGTGPLPAWHPPEPKAKPTEALRKAYRELTKLAHPDHAADAGDRLRRESFMIQANGAYAEGDLGTLSYLLARLARGADVGCDKEIELALDRVLRPIEQARERLDAPTAALLELEASPAAQLMRRARQAEQQGRDLFSKLIAEVSEAKRHALKRLKALDRRLAKLAASPPAS